MDILRLLTRSTKLQQQHSAASAHSLPSAGAPTHPQFLAELDQRDSKNKKRKRGSTERDSTVNSRTDKRHDSVRTDLRPQKNLSASSAVRNEGYVAGDARHLSPDECKDILRTHKIKINLLSYERMPEQKSKTKKRLQNSKNAKYTKRQNQQIYPQPLSSFTELQARFNVSRRLVDNLKEQGYTEPTEIQLASLPLLLYPRDDLAPVIDVPHPDEFDLLTVAPTGSGKTLAFLIPLISEILRSRKTSQEKDQELKSRSVVQAIVLAPTHELVDQIVNEGKKLAAGTGVRISGMNKGVKLAQDESLSDEMESVSLVRSDILVSTPALVANSLDGGDQDKASLPKVRRLVLDEADALLDSLFQIETMAVWQACTSPSLRCTLWSATISSSIETLACEQMDARQQSKESGSSKSSKIVRIIAGLKDSVIPNVMHKITYAANEQGKLLAMRNLLHPSTADVKEVVLRPPFLVFTQTISRAIALHSELLYDIPVEAGGSSRIAVLHSDLTLSARSDIMARFRKGEIWVLITTDLLSRGVDFRGVNGVVNYDIPNTSSIYVHRAGRTGRAGREGGVCVTLYTKEDIPYIKNVANVIAAAEKMKGQASKGEGQYEGNAVSAMPQWLLDALPDLSKTTKKQIKQRGVAARRDAGGRGKVNGRSTMTISTKSGYERRLENRKHASRRQDGSSSKRGERGDDDDNDDDGDGDGDGFDGFED